MSKRGKHKTLSINKALEKINKECKEYAELFLNSLAELDLQYKKRIALQGKGSEEILSIGIGSVLFEKMEIKNIKSFIKTYTGIALWSYEHSGISVFSNTILIN